MDVSPFLEPRIAPRAIFDRAAELRGDARFMVRDAGGGGWRPVSWETYAADVRAMGSFLRALLDEGDRAAIFAANRVEWIEAAMGIQAAGGVVVPIYGSSTAEQAAYVLTHSDARVVFVDSAELLARLFAVWPSLDAVRAVVVLDPGTDPAAVADGARRASGSAPRADELSSRFVPWTRALAVGTERDRAEPGAFDARLGSISVGSNALMLYTSGTSGPPKGVPLTHANIATNGADWLRSNAELLEERATDLLWLPMSHIFGLGEACLGNTLGWTSYLSDPVRVIPDLPAVRPEVFMSVPSVWEKLAASAGGDPGRVQTVTGGRLRFCLSGGAGLKREIKELFERAGIVLIEGYGLTECSPTLTLNRPRDYRFDSVGKPLHSVELKLDDDGEILARGPSVFAGYHKDPAATRAAFTDDGWFRTGDIGAFTPDGFLRIVDRKKDILVTSGGKNVAPANIELRFRDDPFIEHLVVYGDGKKYLVAGVWLRPDAREALAREVTDPAARKDAIERAVRARVDAANRELASFETIKKFRVLDDPLTVENTMLTPTLKVRRKAVYERFGAALEALYA